MKIISHHKTKALPVEHWKTIKKEAEELRILTNQKHSLGRYAEAFAISHAQVSQTPYAFFCVHSTLEKDFGHWCIVNAKIIEESEPTRFKEACMSFPFRGIINTKRFFVITVEYQIPTIFGGLKTITKKLEGLPAYIVQHEIDHAQGISIYEKFRR